MRRVDTTILEASLRCFKRPIIWAAIVLLLLNDHYLKGAFPSWWTGKLSDGAGLFFFPFIVAALFGGLAALMRWERLSGREIGRLAFILVGVWFTLMKVNLAVNGLTIAFWEWLVNGPVFIVMDGSDLLALPVLFPAWRLWERELGAESLKHRRAVVYDWRVWVVAGTAVFAATATSCEPPMQITRVLAVDDKIYAYSPYSGVPDAFSRYDVEDNHWVEGVAVSDAAYEITSQPAVLPITACLTDNDTICYRITGVEMVEKSEDGGQSWEKDWSPPIGRLAFVNRIPLLAICSTRPDLAPFDLIVVGTAENHQVFAALGNQGVLAKLQHGKWERQAVEDAEPVPYRNASPFSVIDKTFFEFVVLILAGIVYFAAQYVVFLRHIEPPKHLPKIIFLLLLGSCIIFFFPDSAPTPIEFFGFIILFGGLILGALIYQSSKEIVGDRWEIKDQKLKTQAISIWWKSSLGLLLAGSLILYFWSAGIIPIYWLMIVILVLVVAGIIYRTFKQYKMILAESQHLQGIPDSVRDGLV